MDIQTEVQKIHHQYSVSEKANYEIQKLFDKAIKEAVTEALRIHDVVGRSEQLTAFAEYCDEEYGLFIPSWMIDGYNKSR
jgi:folylpolyglutamate synthase/dihydropteroate synthase